MLKGIDVSNNNGHCDWNLVAQSGVKFAGLKATGGVRFVDAYFQESLKGCHDHGIIPVAYHFEHDSPSGTGRQEAEHFLDTVKDFKGQLPPCLDLEIPLGGAEHDWAHEFQSTIRAALHLPGTMMYGSSSNLDSWLRNDTFFRADLLWVAHYTSAAQPWIPKPWTKWDIWQYSSSGHVPGVSDSCDMNRFNGDEAALKALVIGGTDDMTPEQAKWLKDVHDALFTNLDEHGNPVPAQEIGPLINSITRTRNNLDRAMPLLDKISAWIDTHP